MFDLIFIWNGVTTGSAINVYFWCLELELHDLHSASSITKHWIRLNDELQSDTSYVVI
jgi:hypothetical protein